MQSTSRSFLDVRTLADALIGIYDNLDVPEAGGSILMASKVRSVVPS